MSKNELRKFIIEVIKEELPKLLGKPFRKLKEYFKKEIL